MRCYLVRHAQTAWNGENRLQGHSDLALSALGLEQARRVGAYFGQMRHGDRRLYTLYVSPLARSLQTAEAIADHTGLRPVVEPGLAEIGLGEWEGLTPEDIDARFQGAYQQWRLAPSAVTIPGAEPLLRFRDRVRQVVARILAASQEEGDLVLVTHGGVIASVLADCLEADYDRFLRRLVLDNAGVSALNGRMRPPHILWVNATTHLDGSHPDARVPGSPATDSML